MSIEPWDEQWIEERDPAIIDKVRRVKKGVLIDYLVVVGLIFIAGCLGFFIGRCV